MTKTVRLIVDVDLSNYSDSVIESVFQNVNTDVIPYITDTFCSQAIPLSATGHVEVVTKYE